MLAELSGLVVVALAKRALGKEVEEAAVHTGGRGGRLGDQAQSFGLQAWPVKFGSRIVASLTEDSIFYTHVAVTHDVVTGDRRMSRDQALEQVEQRCVL